MNDSPAQPIPRKKRRWLRIVLAVFLVLVVAYAAYRYTLHRMVEAKLDEIRKQGYPVTLEELDDFYERSRPSENAANLYVEAFALLQSPNSETKKKLPIIGYARTPTAAEPLAEETSELGLKHLSSQARVLELIKSGAETTTCHFDLMLTNIITGPIPKHYSPLRDAIRLLSLEVLIRASEGETQQAVASMIALIRLSQSVKGEPLLMSHLLQNACLSIAVGTLQQLIARCDLDDDTLGRLQAEFGEAERTQSLLRPMLGDRCMQIAFCSTPKYGPSWEFLGAMEWVDAENAVTAEDELLGGIESFSRFRYLRFKLYRIIGLRQCDFLSYLDHYDRMLQIAELPPSNRISNAAKFRSEIESLSEWKLVTRSTLPAFANTIKHDVNCLLRLRAANTALSIQRYRLQKQKLPDRLDEMVATYCKSVPADAYRSGDLCYRRKSNGFVIYSVGENGVDDGGDEKKDITFTVER